MSEHLQALIPAGPDIVQPVQSPAPTNLNVSQAPAVHPRSGISPERPHFLSEADCHEIAHRLARFARGGGYGAVLIWSKWTGNVRWARNRITTSGEVRDTHIDVKRIVNGAEGVVTINDVSDVMLTAAARRAERLVDIKREQSLYDLLAIEQMEPVDKPPLFSEATYQQDAEVRAGVARTMMQSAIDAGMMSAGYVEVVARSIADIDAFGRTRYFQWTEARYTVTVRDPKGTGSGWAGMDANDWATINAPALSVQALQKCLQARNPVAVEPGRYTTILEPQAVCDFVGKLVNSWALDREAGESLGGFSWYGAEIDFPQTPFVKGASRPRQPALSVLGEKVCDERITISADPKDPALGFPPWAPGFDTYRPAVWIEHGVLTNLAYSWNYAQGQMGRATGLGNSGAFRMSGGSTTVAEMIATTKRGILVTRFDTVRVLDQRSLLCRGYTRDGLWLIENGTVSKPIKNMMFVESIMFALNNVEQLGVPQRVFHPYIGKWDHPMPVVVPPLKINDFSFTALVDAV